MDGGIFSMRWLSFTLFVGVLLCLSGDVYAKGEGHMHVIIFAPKTHQPLKHVKLTCQGRTCPTMKTDADGSVYTKILPGKIVLRLHTTALPKVVVTPQIPIVDGEVTEVLISLKQGKTPSDIEVEAAIRRYKMKQYKLKRKKGPKILLRGRVLSKKTGSPIQGASVYVRGSDEDARSDTNGWFSIRVTVGKHDITIIHPKYNSQNLQGFLVKPKGNKAHIFRLSEKVLELQEFVITTPKIEGSTAELMNQRKQSSTVSEMLGAEEMARTGDSNAGSALKRVSGVTLVGGKFLYIRGLGERYSSTLMNHSTLPSTEPERRVVPLDLFPAGVLQQITIQKTYTADMPGEFGGGAVKLLTRGFPSRFQASISLSFGVVLGSTFSNGLFTNAPATDGLGIDFGYRSLPKIVKEASDKSPLRERDMFSTDGYTAEELKTFGEAMPNTWGTSERMVLPNFGISASLGNRLDLGATKLGFIAYLSYGNDWLKTRPERSFFALGEGKKLVIANKYTFDTLSNNIKLAGILVLGADFGKHHKLRLVSFINRLTDHEVRQYEGYNNDANANIRVTRLRWVEQMLFAQQVRGEHVFTGLNKLRLDWRYTLSVASRIEPDRREYRYDQEPDNPDLWLLSDRPEGNQRFFSELLDLNHDIALDVTLPFLQWGGLKAKLKAGLSGVFKDREVDTRRYKYLHQGPDAGNSDVISKSPGEIFVPEYLDREGFQFGEITRQTDNYLAEQQMFAGYLMGDVPLMKGLRLSLGARFEYSNQKVLTYELFNPDKTPLPAELETFDILPAALISWFVTEKMVLRAAISRTVSRPDFRELSEATFNDVSGGQQISGNADLKRALLTHVDMRWEWYPSIGEAVSFGVFYKHFEQPIESIIIVSSQNLVTFDNAEGANNFGFEFDLRKRFGFLHKALQDFYFAGNFTFVWSRVVLAKKAGTIQTSNERPLQGQSPFVINAQLGYDNVETKTRFALLYNVFGERISSAGSLGAPDTYEQPFHQLDFVFSQTLASGFSINFKAKNLLDLPARFTQGEETTFMVTKGRSFSLSLSYKFK
ncbi:MAG TPA: hypothetical protein DCE42_10950 [Myxococcales bacterium]|nr:hypothetical protein [Deltaproteobacteria bacterium]MBU54262.1 hypothetical protein [Deltaproteobacteria bacterium]HAA55265.1 hypothetical protein [Myxococcales bacterium]